MHDVFMFLGMTGVNCKGKSVATNAPRSSLMQLLSRCQIA